MINIIMGVFAGFILFSALIANHEVISTVVEAEAQEIERQFVVVCRLINDQRIKCRISNESSSKDSGSHHAD